MNLTITAREASLTIDRLTAVSHDKETLATGSKNEVFAAAPSALHRPLAGPVALLSWGVRGFPGIVSSEGALSLDSRRRIVIFRLGLGQAVIV